MYVCMYVCMYVYEGAGPAEPGGPRRAPKARRAQGGPRGPLLGAIISYHSIVYYRAV